jgi:polyadenylate-binding protein
MRGEDGTSKGFGFVNFAEHENAVRAVEEMHGKPLGDSEAIYCARFQKRAERQLELRKQWDILRRERLNKYAGVNLYIKNIEDQIDEDCIKKEFEQYGEIESVKIMKNERNQSRGFGFVCFKTPEAAASAYNTMSQRDKILPGCKKPLYVNYHEPKEIRAQRLQQRYNSNRKYGRGAGVPQPGYYGGGNVPSTHYVQYPNMVPARAARWGPSTPPQFTQPMPPNMMVPGPGQKGMWQQRGDPNAGRGRGRMPPNQIPPNVQQGGAQPIPNMAGMEDMNENFSLQTIANLPQDRQKIVIGEKLFIKVREYEPELAQKITGMFVNSGWPVSEIFDLLQNENKLKEQIDDAVKLLQKRDEEMKGTEEGLELENEDK